MKVLTLTMCALLLSGCNNENPEPIKVAKAETPTPEPAVEPAVEPVAEPAPVAKPEPPKKKKLTHDRCQKVNRQFIQCGWKCIHRGGDVGYCVNSCSTFLNRRGYRCLNIWGPGFG